MRVFLDANILFSAAYREGCGLVKLWDREDIHLVTSVYARMEAERNLAIKRPAALERLHRLMSRVETVTALRELSDDHGLPQKDQPIFAAALASKCTVLLTGDIADFGHLIGKTVEDIRVLTPSLFLSESSDEIEGAA